MADNDEHNDLLTPEEIAALDGEEGEEIDGSAALSDEGTQAWADAGWGDAPARDEADDEADDDEKAAQAAEDAREAERAAEGDQEEAPRPSPAPVPNVAEIDARIAELEGQQSQLFDDYDNGDLTREEYDQKIAEIRAVERQVVADKAVAQQAAQDDQKAWDSAVEDYFKDYGGLKDPNVMPAFDAEVRVVTSAPVFANMSFREQLALAHERLIVTAEKVKLDGVPAVKGKAPDPKPQTPAQREPDPRGDDMRTPPPTLARVPASDMSDVSDSKYASLQRLSESGDLEAFEAAMEKLTPQERDEFSSMAL